MNNFLEVQKLKRQFDSGEGEKITVLKEISFCAKRGETLSIIGRSGAGKSVLLHLLGGLDYPTTGKCLLDGKDIYNRNAEELAALRNRSIGFIFQFNQLLADFSAVENVMIPALIKGETKKDALAKANDLLSQMSLSNRANYKVNKLSGGEQQRIAIARALINDPALILADEPTGSLDYATGQMVLDILLKAVNRTKSTLIFVTHNLELASLMGYSLEISDGKIFKKSI
ncbi:MAG: ABC transporter ATP-binding protein [SAR324 cluster bacterium]|nr:ABC transporter ATP-binding protein [SAR324 cluster bacterium]